MKLDAATGKLLGTFPGRKGPNFVAFDGGNIWVTNFTDNSVSKF
jgi:DNA-binding beta-propeller fold protein YncE